MADIKVIYISDDEMEMTLDIKNTNCTFVNSLRRIILSEIPTMAIENVNIFENSSDLQDKIIANRLGLVPIKVDSTMFEFIEEDEAYTGLNTILFRIDETYDETDPYIYSGHLKWIPMEGETGRFKNICPVYDDIPIMKLKRGQRIKLDAYCEKGIGSNHSKWSPVSTVSYNFFSEIVITKPIIGDIANEFASLFPDGVVNVSDKDGRKIAEIGDPVKAVENKEVLFNSKFKENVRLDRDDERFIFNIESIGIVSANELFKQSLEIITNKMENLTF